MAINKIQGNILSDNLQRGANLAIQGNLIYFDVINDRVGIKTTGSSDDFTVAGTANTANIRVTSATANGIFYAGATKLALTNSNLVFDGSTLTLAGTGNIGNITSPGTITATGNVTGGNLVTAGTVDANAIVVDSITVAGNLDVGNLSATGDVVANNVTGNSTVSSGNIVIDGITGNIDLGSGWVNNASDPIANTDLATKFYVDSIFANVQLGNFTFVDTTISTNEAVANITLAPTGNSEVIIDTNSGLVLPVGTQGERPGSAITGTLRFNSDTGLLEFYNGSTWDVIESNYNIASQTIPGNGIDDTFTLNQSTTAEGVILTINGITQIPNTNYTISGNVLVMNEPPQVVDTVEVRYITGASATGSVATGAANRLAYYPSAGSIVNDTGANLTWNGADQLTVAGNVSVTGGFLQVPVYANSTVRDTAIASPQAGMIVLTGTTFEGYNGATWVTLG
jgi:filamentous hemagglutinin